MTVADLFYPALAQVGLTLFLALWMGRARFRAVAMEKVRVSQIALGQRAWPEPVQRVCNAFHNQLELPILFYAALLFAMQTGYLSGVFLAAAWMFVVLRVVHAFIHTSGRNIRLRFMSFAAGALTLVAMWVLLTMHVIVTSS